jgi:O-antigen ligase
MPLSTALPPSALSKPTLRKYLIALGILYVGVVLYLVLEKGPRLWGPALGLPVVLAIVTNPRLAVYQFLFCLFIDLRLFESPTIYLIDIGAGLLVLAAIFDILLNVEVRGERPPLVFNYLAVLAALAIAAVFSVQPAAAVFPIARVTFLFAVFLSLVRLSSVVTFADSLRAFFVLMTVHAIFAVVPSIASGGRIRSFGFAESAFDDLAMLLIPCGLSIYLWSKESSRRWYFIGTLVILAALIGTQTRFAILVCFVLCGLVIIVSGVQARRLRADGISVPPIGHRAGNLMFWLVVMSLLFVVIVPSVLERALARFSAAATTTPGGTMLLRLTLWKAAITVFFDNPLTGIGPGVFRHVDQYYGSLMFGPTYIYVRGLSAHNLFLHYLAETGIIGVGAMLILFFNQFRLARRIWRENLSPGKTSYHTGLMVVSFGLLLTAFLEGSWMWGATGFAATYFIAMIGAGSRPTTAGYGS